MVRKLLRQQAAIASFGSFAFRSSELCQVLSEAARACAVGLDAPFSKVCRYREATNDLLVEAGHGWGADVVGCVVSPADQSSPQGRAFVTGQPSVCADVRVEPGFELPPFYAEYGIISTIDVAIKSGTRPYGVLEIDNDVPQDYDHHDIDFLIGFANVLAEAVANQAHTEILQVTVERLRILAEEKDRLLEEKRTLAQELQHRVRNNLQLIYGMLSKQLDDTEDKAGQRGLQAIVRRVSTIAQVYDHLLGTELSRTTDFGSYTRSLCLSLAEMLAPVGDGIVMDCDVEPVFLDLDTVTALGIVVAEVVTNAYDHAFPDGKGKIHLSLRHARSDEDYEAELTISDDGPGFDSQAESKRHGLGLVRRLVEQVGGTATLVSERGTLWTIIVPRPTASPGLAPLNRSGGQLG